MQAEDYDAGGNGVAYNQTVNGSQSGYRSDNNGDIHSGAGPGGSGYALGWSDTGDWYKYTVAVQAAGSYTAAFQVASAGVGGAFHLEDEAGHNLTGSLTAPNTGGWGNWQTITSPAFFLSAGTHVLRLVEDANGPNPWVCDFDFIAVTGSALSATTLTVANATGSADQAITLNATLKKTSGTALSGKTLTFSVDGAAAGTAVTSSAGAASLRYTVPVTLAVGSHTLVVSFAGDGSGSAASGTGTLTAAKSETAVTLTNAVGTHGKAVTLSARLRRIKNGIALGAETLTFRVDGQVVGTAVTASNGLASLSYALPAGTTAGTHPLGVSFAGDSAYNPSSATGTLTVN